MYVKRVSYYLFILFQLFLIHSSYAESTIAVANETPQLTLPSKTDTNTPRDPFKTIQPTLTVKPQIRPNPPKLEAKAYLLMDANTGKILVEHQIDEKFPPASLTKMLTMYVVSAALQNKKIQLSDAVYISRKAWQTEGSRMFVKVDTHVKLEDLIKGIIIQSGNDACIAVAEHVAGSEPIFVDLMNQYAKEIGMTQSHFVTTTGLPDPNHYSTARDLALLARALIRDFPEDYAMYKEKWFVFNAIRQPNRNRLLWRDPTVDGIKTGHTADAGYCLVASAQRQSMRLIAVVLGATSDNNRSDATQRLLEYGFRFFENHTLFTGKKPIHQVRIWQSTQKNLEVGLEKDLNLTIPQGSYPHLKAEIIIPNAIVAPIKKGDSIGTLQIQLNNEIIDKQNLIALYDIPAGNFWIKIRDSIALLLHQWFGTKSSNMQAQLG